MASWGKAYCCCGEGILFLCLSLLQSWVDGDEGTSMTHFCTAVQQDGFCTLLPVSHHLLAEYHERSTIIRNTVVRPGGEVVLSEGQAGLSVFSKLRKGSEEGMVQ